MKKVVELKEIVTWDKMKAAVVAKDEILRATSALPISAHYQIDEKLNTKISIWRGDITKLKVDAVVNAANTGLWAGGGICGAIHSAAGRELAAACKVIGKCRTGDTKLTPGFKLPSKYVLHTVGPTDRDPKALRSCYETTLALCLKHKIRSVVFCCVSTGIYGFDNTKAAYIALDSVRNWLNSNGDAVDRIIFCTFQEEDDAIYKTLAPVFFPTSQADVDKRGNKTLRAVKSTAAKAAAPSPAASSSVEGAGEAKREAEAKGNREVEVEEQPGAGSEPGSSKGGEEPGSGPERAEGEGYNKLNNSPGVLSQ